VESEAFDAGFKADDKELCALNSPVVLAGLKEELS